jgi:hypothetical protein
MTINLSRLLILLVLAFQPCAAAASWPAPETRDAMGLPTVNDGDLEIRVWLGGGVLQPYDLYRIRKSPQGVTGELIAWSEVTQPQEDLDTAKEARRENAAMRKLLQKEHCASELHETSTVMWCVAKTRRHPKWHILLDDLMPEELWKLPDDLIRDCGAIRVDGEIIAIELVEGSRYHAVSYDNPDFCCSQVACALANHVRYVLKFNAR